MAAGVALGDEDDPSALRERLTFLLRCAAQAPHSQRCLAQSGAT